MIDRAIALFGLAIALVVGLYAFAPAEWPKMPAWATLSGIGVGVLLFGVGVGLLIADWRGPGVPRLPELHVQLVGANVFIPDQMPTVTGIGLNARVWNTGAPSIVTGWDLRIIPNGRNAVKAQLTKMPNVLTADGPFNSAILSSGDSLEEKAQNTEVGIVPVKGVLLFLAPLPKDVVQDSKTVWELTAKDIYEKEVKATQLMGDWLSR